MQGLSRHECSICKRLGKEECGYHKFKNDFLERMSKSQLKEHQQQQGNATQASLQATSGNRGQGSNREQGHQSNVSIQYHESHVEQQGNRYGEYRENTGRVENTHVQQVQTMHQMPQVQHHPSPQNVQYQQPPQQIQHHPLPPQYNMMPPPPQNHIVRVEGDQILYYPIYPVYEVVYEPAETSNSSSILSTPSRVIYN